MKMVKVKEFDPIKVVNLQDSLFADGGVIGKNPSYIGGTWAYRHIEDGLVKQQSSGVLSTGDELKTVTNNITELWAIISALSSIFSPDWKGIIYSDSKVSLGRFFLGWSLTNVPDWIISEMEYLQRYMKNFDKIRYGLLQGHPTNKDLILGYGSKGYPVSEHNKWCDRECSRLARIVEEENGK